MLTDERKQYGAYYTPEEAVHSLVRWAVRRPTDRLLDPSSGDGRFLAQHRRCVGVEQDASAAALSRSRAPWALVHEGEFFNWAASTRERFECAAGNPPFIRYQRFSGETREHALRLCSSLGASFSGLTASWAPFLVAAASLLKPAGRMAFVVPAEIGHAPYAQPLLRYLSENFQDVRLLAVRTKIFQELSEDVWLLYAGGFGGQAKEVLFTPQERFFFCPEPPTDGVRISMSEWQRWRYRFRPFLAGKAARELYQHVAEEPESRRLGSIAQVGIGYVTGANNFFHLRPSEAKRIGIPGSLLQPTVRNSRALCGNAVTKPMVRKWIDKDEPVLLLRLTSEIELPESVQRYLDTPAGREARATYKCSNRSPWYVVPEVIIPDAFLSYMSGEGPALVANHANCACTNSVHAIRLLGDVALSFVQQAWDHPYTRLSCEIEGHPLGGGMLKVEPREAQRIVLPGRHRWQRGDVQLIAEGLDIFQSWRHYGGDKTATRV